MTNLLEMQRIGSDRIFKNPIKHHPPSSNTIFGVRAFTDNTILYGIHQYRPHSIELFLLPLGFDKARIALREVEPDAILRAGQADSFDVTDGDILYRYSHPSK